MKRLIPALLLATAVLAQTAMTNLADIRKIYIEPMPNNLNQYLTSEISKQFHGSLTVVLQQSDADAIMKGVNAAAQDTTIGTVQIVDLNGKTILWSGTAKDGDKVLLNLNHRGEDKVAANLVSQLKKAMQGR
jgi:hypothetical protein